MQQSEARRAHGALDIDKFAKVHRLMTEGATQGERAAAQDRAEALARRAGMTVDQAASKVDARSAEKPANPFAGFADWMEEREPGWKAQEARKHAARAAAKAKRRADLLRRHGTAEALFDRTPIEEALFQAVTPFAKRSRHPDWVGEREVWFTNEIDGAGEFEFLRKASPDAISAVRNAWPMPPDLEGLLVESRMWRQLSDDRQAFIESEYRLNLEDEARIEVIEHELDTRPVTCWADMQARFDWERFKFERQWIDPTENREEGILPRLRQDFAILRKLYEAPAQNGRDQGDSQGRSEREHPSIRRTNADKQRDVLSMLDAEPDLSDREVARRCGVSPQTVGNWRKKASAKPSMTKPQEAA